MKVRKLLTDAIAIASMGKKIETEIVRFNGEIMTHILNLKMLEMEQKAPLVINTGPAKPRLHPMTAMTKEQMAREGVLVSPEKSDAVADEGEGIEGVHSDR